MNAFLHWLYCRKLEWDMVNQPVIPMPPRDPGFPDAADPDLIPIGESDETF